MFCLNNSSSAQDIEIQMVMGEGSPEYEMLSQFAANVNTLTDGQVRFQILPKGTKVGTKGLLEAINSGEVDAGFAWTHYWSGYHPATMLFGSPTAGAGLGLDNISWVSWFMYGGGRELYDQLWSEMGMNIKGVILQPSGPEALGWFQEPIENMDDFVGRLVSLKEMTIRQVNNFSKTCNNEVLNRKISMVTENLKKLSLENIDDKTLSRFLILSRLKEELAENNYE